MSLISRIDNYIFIKKGVSFYTHLVPFAIVSLLIVVNSAADEKLFKNLSKSLEKPDLIYFPALFLTAVVFVIYYISLKEKISNAYLWPDRIFQRTICTSIIIMIICTMVTFFVVSSATNYQINSGKFLACILVASLSLTGYGWSLPSSLAKFIEEKSPNYNECHQNVAKITEILIDVRKKSQSTEQDVNEFYEAVKNLYSLINKNMLKEAKWAKGGIENVAENLYSLMQCLETNFLKTQDPNDIANFADASNGKDESGRYTNYIIILNNLGEFWYDWKITDSK